MAPYFMDDPREGERLSAKVNAPDWVSRRIAPLLSSGLRFLDVGCGSGAIVTEAARRYPSCLFIGIDLSEERLSHARTIVKELNNAMFVKSAATSLPFIDSSFDVVHCRLLLQYLTERDKAVKEMAKVCATGGYVTLHDLDGQLVWHYPEDPQLQQGIADALETLKLTGFDPFCGRKLFHLMRNAGLEDIRVEVSPYHLIVGKASVEVLKQWAVKLSIAAKALERSIGASKADQIRKRFLDYLSDDTTLTYSVMFSVTGRKK